MTPRTVADVARLLDHAVLKPELTAVDLARHAAMCVSRGVGCLCVRSCDVAEAVRLVAGNPVENRNILTLGFLSKLISSIAALAYVVGGRITPWFALMVFFSDVIYLPFFYIIMRQLYAAARADGRGRP